MSDHAAGALGDVEVSPTSPPATVWSSRFARRRAVDHVARLVVSTGGIVVVVAILAILLVTGSEAYPLFLPPRIASLPAVPAPAASRAMAVVADDYREVAAVVTGSGIEYVSLATGGRVAAPGVDLGGATVTAVSRLGREEGVLALSDGRAIPVTLGFDVERESGTRVVVPALRVSAPVVIDAAGRALTRIAYAALEDGSVTAATVGPRELAIVRATITPALIGSGERSEHRAAITLATRGSITSLAADRRGDSVLVGTDAGEVAWVNLRGSEPAVGAIVQASPASITSLGLLIGDWTFVVGDEKGGVASWQLLDTGDGRFGPVRIHEFEGHAAPVRLFTASLRNKGFWTGATDGSLRFHYGTTGATLAAVDAGEPDLRALELAPKSNGLLACSASGRLLSWEIHAPHPEVSWGALFGKVWYEGYPGPAHVWQSTGGTDDFEAKLGLTPLIYGTLKGTFYALVFAIPIALLSALYASQFMHPTLKAVVKPTVEVMAALPTVVLGFIAGLWLAPTVEPIVPGIFLMPPTVAMLILLALAAYRALPIGFRLRIRAGTEIFVLIPIVVLGGWLAIELGRGVETWLLGGDYRTWLASTLGLTYDQRNSLVVGLAMGFAVIPIIFTIAEDSLANVPPHLTAGSLALGATRWQTAVRVILPSASPGIFSAVMIGFGRAVGETMIVLMATGNTPVMDPSIFNGFRALSANIAVELPEAPEGGTLFRVLFLAALILFVMTFAVNTVAELVRLRLRERYRSL
ncbi:MAG: phosphate transport system permease protein [Candidatus Binatota bacterium]|nr:phosphate transport system permease protein [Candidatus Binatota bacterium]